MDLTLIVGDRKSGKTHEALRLARESGRSFVVIEPGPDYRRPEGIGEVALVVVDGAHALSVEMLELAEAMGMDMIVTAATPADPEAHRWLQSYRDRADTVLHLSPGVLSQSEAAPQAPE